MMIRLFKKKSIKNWRKLSFFCFHGCTVCDQMWFSLFVAALWCLQQRKSLRGRRLMRDDITLALQRLGLDSFLHVQIKPHKSLDWECLLYVNHCSSVIALLRSPLFVSWQYFPRQMTRHSQRWSPFETLFFHPEICEKNIIVRACLLREPVRHEKAYYWVSVSTLGLEISVHWLQWASLAVEIGLVKILILVFLVMLWMV